jgi:ankyrin repeat protein
MQRKTSLPRRIHRTRSCSEFSFRWVFCQFDFLRHCLPARIRRALGELPESLDGTYERILQDINRANWESARRLFQCVAVASRPLLIEELAEFLAFDFDVEPTPVFRMDWRPEDPIDAVLSTCSSLLAVVKRGDLTFIQFSHFSVKEYLTSTRLAGAKKLISRYHISMAPAHTLMAQACLGILLHLDEKEITRDRLKNFPIVEYAAKYWVDHARFDSVSANTQDAMKRLFDPRTPHLAVWLWIYDPTISWRIRSERPTQPKGSCLHYSACFGFHDLVMFLLNECSPDVNARGFDDMTALHWASRGGHLGTAQVLLERGADVRVRDKKKWTPLRYALDRGHIEVARVLLEHGAETRAQGMDRWIPLCWASRHGHVEVVRLLLKHGAEASTRDRNKSTPLHLALEGGHVEVALLLLDYGAVAGAQDKNKSSAMHLASKGGHTEVVQVILERNVDVNVEDKDEATPLRYALEEGHVEVTRLLLEYRAGTNAQGKDEWIPLCWASRHGHVEVARLLLMHGANFQDKHESTPLHLASHNGHVEVAQLLLEYHADANAKKTDKSTPLHLASRSGHVEVARLLLEHGVDASAQDKSKSTPLHLASAGGYVEVARLLLLQHGVDPSAQDKSKSTPLHLASAGGYVELARLLLLQHGVDPSAQDVNKRTPLHIASKNGHAELARVLLQPEHGVDVDGRDMNIWTSLHWASRGGHVEVALVLLQCGADAKAEDADKWTPLHLLSGDGEVEAARLVLGRGVETGSQGMVKLLQLYRHLQTQGHVGIPLEHSDDAVVRDLSKWVPLQYRNRGSVELARVLLMYGADVGAQDKNNSTPLHWASGCGLVKLAQMLLENGAVASAQDKDKSTPLHRVSESGQVAFVRAVLRRDPFSLRLYRGMWGELAELLLTHHADVGAQDKDKFSPLHLASGGAGFWGSAVALRELGIGSLDEDKLRPVSSKLMRLVRVLLANDADVRARDKNNSTPLHWTSGGGYVKLARTLLKHHDAFGRRSRPNLSVSGSDRNQGNIERIHANVTRVLLEHGADADVNVQDIFGLTPLGRARRARFSDIIQLLLSNNPT